MLLRPGQTKQEKKDGNCSVSSHAILIFIHSGGFQLKLGMY